MTASHIWDASTVAALDAIVKKYERNNKQVVITGLNQASSDIHLGLAGNLGGGH